ncbi:complement C5 [Cricetulus griseus]|nr:complement C5 [Cricetulus griseus]
MGFWGILLVLVFLEKSWGQEQIFFISVPAVFRIGVPANITVQAPGHTHAFDATISVKSYPDENISYSSGSVNLSPENKFRNSAILTVQAKQLSEGQSSFSYVYLEVMSKHFSKSEKIPIIHDNGSLFIHTDKPVYTPQESVKVGVYSLDDDLEPVTRGTVLTFIDPEGSEVDTIQGNNHTAIVSFPDFKIPSNPKYGRWTIKAKYREDATTNGTTHFDIKEHDKAYKITLMPISDLQHQVANQGEAQGVTLQPADYLQQKINERASTYKHQVPKKCCYDGAVLKKYETCEQRAERVKIGLLCVRAFISCCTLANEIRANDTFKHIHVSKHHYKAYKITLMPISDLQHQVANQGEAQGVTLQPADYLQQKINERASTYKHQVPKKCCYDGAVLKKYETCEQRAERVKIGPLCVRAFISCCTLAKQIRTKHNTFKDSYIASVPTPKVFQVGASENVVIQAHGYTEAFDATISIRSYPDKKITYSSGYVNLSPENKFQNSAMLTIQPSQLPGEQDPVSHVYLEVVSKHFSKSKKMPLSYDNGFLFIHTDKPVYTPDQSVKVRVYSLNDDLKPAKRETVLTFIDPEGSEVDIMEENDYTGIISFPDFKIPSNPKYGVWTIKAKYKKDFSTTGAAYFEIKEYVLPRFSVSIEPESNFIGFKNFKNFEITVKARYFYNKVVPDAEVYVFFGLRESIKEDQKEMMQKAMQVTTSKLTVDLGHTLDPWAGLRDPTSTSGFSEEAEIPGIKYVLSPYTLNLVATPLFLKPGIPFSIKVQVKDSLEQLVGGVPVTLTAQTVDVNQETSDLEPKRSVTHTTDGVASFVVNLPSEVTALNFNVKTDAPELPEENQASKEYQAITYSSLSQSYIYIAWTENYKPVLVGEFLNIIVTPKSPYIDKITHYNYLILSKGKIVQYGTKEKFLHSSYQNINIAVTQNMVPSARLLVYYIVTGEQTAELVADSVWINIEEKCGNQLQVHLSPDADSYSPGQTVSLDMVTKADSWVALAAVDSAVYGVQERVKRPMQRVKSTPEVFQAFDKSDLGCGAGGGRNNADVFNLAGLTFLTNANADDSQHHGESCEEILRPKRDLHLLQRTIEEQAAKYKHRVPRKCCLDGARLNEYETCAQRVARVTIGPNCVRAFNECCIIATKIRQEGFIKPMQLGRIRICVADTLKAKVFKDVFLEMNIPYSVVRGEQIQLKGTVYNYRTSGTMPEGVKRESYAGFTLDPNGIYGMVSIMSYRNSDYSYSMWKGGSASTWLTAFALRVLGQVAKYVKQDQNSICNSLLWLIENCQLENGSFKENSQYLPVKLQGTLPVEAQERTLYLTAFSVIGIRKAIDICPLMKINTALAKADSFLLEKALPSKSTFTLAIVAYALSLGDKTHPQFRSVVSALKREALVKGDPPFYRFWKDTLQHTDSSVPNSGSAGMVETTAYALLTSLNLKETNYVNPIIKWLSEEQRYGGGFYSTQDTINAIEGLTEYSLLAKQLHLNMDINVSYKHKGDFYQYKMTEKNFLGRPVEVPVNDDLIITTGFSNGLATVYVKTVVHKTSISDEFCSFYLKIDTQDIDASSYPSRSDSGHKHIIACASYKPSREESASGSSHAVMDISLPTGIGANQEDLRAASLVEGVDQLLNDYQIKDGHVILQLNSIPSRDFLCVRFRIFELFQVGFLNPATFTVYEYHRPDKQCTMFYSTSDSRLQRVCEGTACKCVEADCGQLQVELDLSISANTRKETACKPEIAYAYKVRITATTEENIFVKYTATLLDIYRAGDAAAEKDSEITFIRKMSCANADLVKGKQYLIMGKEALQIKHNFSFRYIYPLDSSTWIEYWPTDRTCTSCQAFLANLDEFVEDIFLNGCENA